MEPDIEGNDNVLMHLAREKETETTAPSVNQHTIIDLTINQIKRSESTRNTHEQRKYETSEDSDIGGKIYHQIVDEDYTKRDITM